MKKQSIKITLALLILLTLLTSYIVLGQNSPQAVSEKFLKTVYQVDQREKEQVKALLGQISASDDYKYFENYKDHLMDTYGVYLTEKGFNRFMGNRYELFFAQVDMETQFTSEVTQIDLSPSLEEEDHKVYDFVIRMIYTYSDGQEEEVIEDGYVNLVKIDGRWLIDKFRLDGEKIIEIQKQDHLDNPTN